MATISFTIPNEQIDRVRTALKGLYPIPTTTDEETGETTPDFTDAQWGKECIRRWVIKQVKRYEEIQAKQAVDITVEDSLVQ